LAAEVDLERFAVHPVDVENVGVVPVCRPRALVVRVRAFDKLAQMLEAAGRRGVLEQPDLQPAHLRVVGNGEAERKSRGRHNVNSVEVWNEGNRPCLSTGPRSCRGSSFYSL